MKILRVVLVVTVAVAVSGQPQRQRQSPLSMGLKMLGDLRDNMTKRLQGLFGGGAQSNKPAQRPPVQSLQHNIPPPPRPPPIPQQPAIPPPSFHQPQPESVHQGGVLPSVVQSHGGPSSSSGSSGPQSSFFAVVHEPSAPAPAPTGHAFRAPPPFQGTIDEDHLPRPPTSQGRPLPLEDNHLPPDTFPPHGPSTSSSSSSAGPSSTAFTSFGSRGPPEQSDSAGIPFGNTATFTLGAFRPEPAPHSILQPDEALELRETHQHFRPDQSTPQRFRSDHSAPQPFRSDYSTPQHFRSDHSALLQLESPTQQPSLTLLQSPTESDAHPQITLLSNSPSPTHTPFTAQRKSSEGPEESKTEVQSRKDGKTEARKGGVVNTGIKMKVTSTHNEDGTRASEVSEYEFGYGVLDKPSGNQFFHAEKKEEGQTKGSYKIQLPDGRVQTVTYVANNQGFHPKITYDGEAHYPISSTTSTTKSP